MSEWLTEIILENHGQSNSPNQQLVRTSPIRYTLLHCRSRITSSCTEHLPMQMLQGFSNRMRPSNSRLFILRPWAAIMFLYQSRTQAPSNEKQTQVCAKKRLWWCGRIECSEFDDLQLSLMIVLRPLHFIHSYLMRYRVDLWSYFDFAQSSVCPGSLLASLNLLRHRLVDQLIMRLPVLVLQQLGYQI